MQEKWLFWCNNNFKHTADRSEAGGRRMSTNCLIWTKTMPWLWIEHRASRSSVLRSPNWAIKACLRLWPYLYLFNLHLLWRRRLSSSCLNTSPFQLVLVSTSTTSSSTCLIYFTTSCIIPTRSSCISIQSNRRSGRSTFWWMRQWRLSWNTVHYQQFLQFFAFFLQHHAMHFHLLVLRRHRLQVIVYLHLHLQCWKHHPRQLWLLKQPGDWDFP